LRKLGADPKRKAALTWLRDGNQRETMARGVGEREGWEEVHAHPQPRESVSEEDPSGNQTPAEVTSSTCSAAAKAGKKGPGHSRKAGSETDRGSESTPAARSQGPAEKGNKIQRAIGRLLERYPRVARYYELLL